MMKMMMMIQFLVENSNENKDLIQNRKKKQHLYLEPDRIMRYMLDMHSLINYKHKFLKANLFRRRNQLLNKQELRPSRSICILDIHFELVGVSPSFRNISGNSQVIFNLYKRFPRET